VLCVNREKNGVQEEVQIKSQERNEEKETEAFKDKGFPSESGQSQRKQTTD
jgi:hypothetical protein